MVQKSGEKPTWDGAKTLDIMGHTTNLNWFSRRISGCHQQHFTIKFEESSPSCMGYGSPGSLPTPKIGGYKVQDSSTLGT